MLDRTGEGGVVAHSGWWWWPATTKTAARRRWRRGRRLRRSSASGEEDGEVRRVEGVAKVVAVCVGGVRTGRGEDDGLRFPGGSGIDGAATST